MVPISGKSTRRQLGAVNAPLNGLMQPATFDIANPVSAFEKRGNALAWLAWAHSGCSASMNAVPRRAWFEAGLHMELGEAGLTFPGWTMAP